MILSSGTWVATRWWGAATAARYINLRNLLSAGHQLAIYLIFLLSPCNTNGLSTQVSLPLL